MNIAILTKDFFWGGGVDFIRLIVNALVLKSKEQNLTIHLLIPDDRKLTHILDLFSMMARIFTHNKQDSIRKNQDFEIILRYRNEFQNINRSLKVVTYYNSKRGLIHCLKKNKFDALLPVLFFWGKDFPIPWIGYWADFQHKYYPEYFTSDECLERDIVLATTLRDTNAVIVNSKAVKNDIDKFYPYHQCRIFVLPFAPHPMDSWLNGTDVKIKEKYRLPERFFLISNQLWIHKSHITAFEALANMKDKSIHIVCTGHVHDYRFPRYFNDLKEKIKSLNIEKRVHFLGYIPKMDQISIMKEAVAVLQPTLFEGGPGGGAVHDAIALGIPAVVSDIPVNLEIEEANVFFFKSGSSEDMAKKMQMISECNQGLKSKEELLNKGLLRTHQLGDRLLEAIRYAINH